jgi:ADP-ribose pyrophosphatase YjhB (NUDIX family)
MRYRATALIIRDGRVLLVKDKGRHDYSMPGGGFKPGESTIQGTIREVNEELKLKTVSATRLEFCDLEGKRGYHKVCLLVVEGEPHIDHKELDGYIWWDMKEQLPLQGHVKYILSKYESRNVTSSV